MPHVEVRYSEDLNLRVVELFTKIEQLINETDASSGECKSRAYKTNEFLHTHLYMQVSLLKKDHRDNAFMLNLRNQLIQLVSAELPSGCCLSVEMNFSSELYYTAII